MSVKDKPGEPGFVLPDVRSPELVLFSKLMAHR